MSKKSKQAKQDIQDTIESLGELRNRLQQEIQTIRHCMAELEKKLDIAIGLDKRVFNQDINDYIDAKLDEAFNGETFKAE